MPIVQAPTPQVRQRPTRKHIHAAHVAINNGVLCVCRDAPVLDVGCRNPYAGMYAWLRRIDWRGQYVGIDSTIPQETIDRYKGDIYVRSVDLSGRLPFPPSDKHPFKEYSTAFCVDTLARVREREHLIMEMRRIAAQVVVVGDGFTTGDLKAWDFQFIGLEPFGGVMQPWGVWLNDWAFKTRQRLDIVPRGATGFFDGANGVEKKMIYRCVKCGEFDYDGREHFRCRQCNAAN